MTPVTWRRLAGLGLILVAGIAAFFAIGTLMASCQAQVGQSPAPTESASSVPTASSSAQATASPGGSPVAPGDSPGASWPSAQPTFAGVPPPPRQPGPSIEIPPPID
jgi:hypothetical protein